MNPIDDAYVAGELAVNNFGQTTDLQSDISPVRESYMKFDLRPLAGLNISQATLRMFVTSGSANLQNIKQVADNGWTESALTFNNRPAMGATVTTFTPGSTTGAYLQVPITSAVASGAGSFLSLAIDNTGSDGFTFNSAEADTNKVEIVIQWSGGAPSTTPTPTPTPAPTLTPTPGGASPTPSPTATPTPAPGGGIVFQSSATVANTAASASLVVAKPAGTVPGDVLVASVVVSASTVSAAPAGWVEIAAVTTAANPTIYSYYHVAGAAEPASYSWTLSTSTTGSAGIARYSGVSNASPLDVPASTAGNSAAVSSLAVPAVTTTRPGALLIGGAAVNSSNLTVLITAPGGMTERWDLGGKRHEYDDALQAAVGSSGSRTWTFSAARAAAAWLAALRPAP